MPTPNMSFYGHDLAGLESALTTSPNLLNADAGVYYFATDTLRVWACQGAGLWQLINANNNGVPGSAGSIVSITKLLTGMTDATATNLFTATLPNLLLGGGINIDVAGTLGDGDSTEMSTWNAALSRVAGANAKTTISTIGEAAIITGAAGNAAVVITNAAVSGGVTAANVFQYKATVTKSAGSSANHFLLAQIKLLNSIAAGIVIA